MTYEERLLDTIAALQAENARLTERCRELERERDDLQVKLSAAWRDEHYIVMLQRAEAAEAKLAELYRIITPNFPTDPHEEQVKELRAHIAASDREQGLQAQLAARPAVDVEALTAELCKRKHRFLCEIEIADILRKYLPQTKGPTHD